jgi:hypothetical protein
LALILNNIIFKFISYCFKIYYNEKTLDEVLCCSKSG